MELVLVTALPHADAGAAMPGQLPSPDRKRHSLPVLFLPQANDAGAEETSPGPNQATLHDDNNSGKHRIRRAFVFIFDFFSKLIG